MALKVLVVVFAVIHLGIWGASEVRGNRKMVSTFNTTPNVRRMIATFDLVEAFVLAALGVVAALYMTHPK